MLPTSPDGAGCDVRAEVGTVGAVAAVAAVEATRVGSFEPLKSRLPRPSRVTNPRPATRARTSRRRGACAGAGWLAPLQVTPLGVEPAAVAVGQAASLARVHQLAQSASLVHAVRNGEVLDQIVIPAGQGEG